MPGTRKAVNKTVAKKPAAKKATTAAKRGAPKGPREAIVTPDRATFDTDDKRAQYARLIIFNFAKSKDSKANVGNKDVNSVSDGTLTAAGKELVGGNMIKGADGLDLIMKLSKEGSTTGRPLTKAYAAEVRPFLRRLKLAPSFGRRSGARKAKDVADTNGGEATEAAEAPVSGEQEAVAAE